jgi:hypothetical protein
MPFLEHVGIVEHLNDGHSICRDLNTQQHPNAYTSDRCKA